MAMMFLGQGHQLQSTLPRGLTELRNKHGVQKNMKMF